MNGWNDQVFLILTGRRNMMMQLEFGKPPFVFILFRVLIVCKHGLVFQTESFLVPYCDT